VINKEVERALTAKLAKLGDTPDAVAATLLAEGCRGKPAQSARCPVARYLQKLGWSEVSVGLRDASIFDDGINEIGVNEIATPRFSRAVAEFIFGFDADEYPGLYEPDPEAATDERA
jgi:hypothetical protein